MEQDMFFHAQNALADRAGLVLFTAVRDTAAIRSFTALLQETSASNPDPLSLVSLWGAFMASLVETEGSIPDAAGRGDWYHTLAWLTLWDDNPFTRAAEAHSGELDFVRFPAVLALAKGDLSRLGRLAAFDLSGLAFYLGMLLRDLEPALDIPAQAIEAEGRLLGSAAGTYTAIPLLDRLFPFETDWALGIGAFATYIHQNGAGALGLYRSFRWVGPGHALKPVLNPDEVRLSSLTGYQEQRSLIIANTLRFLQGKPAHNLLLYGDRGTGKSATVKAVCNHYAHQGLRLLEVSKEKLVQLPAILETLGGRGMRFIIFIDDLSFEKTDDAFTTLKMLLEGGMEVRPSQVVIYATSNRRHLVKELTADRPTTAMAANALATGDMRAFDTMQEQFSLADRFGLTVVFSAPGQEEYLAIAEALARERGLLTGPAEGETWRTFRADALRWERWFNGRSPRTAVQYVDWIAGGADFPWPPVVEAP
ncbi:MAG: ATP-binding protein [Spirochaetaceae bacterium]|jgi:predicted AAA+ superfamily ATPase|nr:ATP-binding protein [Spirochaetaceae bacterium]